MAGCDQVSGTVPVAVRAGGVRSGCFILKFRIGNSSTIGSLCAYKFE